MPKMPFFKVLQHSFASTSFTWRLSKNFTKYEWEKALIVLVVDLLDFPCSLWPGIADIFADKPLVVVGNKVDLLLQDSEKFLNTIKKALHESLLRDGFGSCDIKHIELISAKTGFGIENLITKLHSLYSLKGMFIFCHKISICKC